MAGFYEQRDQDGILIGWQAKVRRKGYPSQTKVFHIKRDAEAWARSIESEMDRGVFAPRGESEKTTLGECFERYLENVTPTKKPGSRRQESGFIRQWLHRPISQRTMASIRGMDVAVVIKDMETEGKSPNTVRLHLAVLSHLFKVARTEWGMESISNPVEAVRKPKLPQGRDRRLVDDEEQRLLDACRATNPELALIVTIAIETAMRQGEIMGMTWSMVNLPRRTITLSDTKNGSKRVVPLSTKAIEVLKALPHRIDGKVWSYTADGLRASYSKAANRAGIDGLTFHDLRHEATSRLFEKKLNPMEVSAITGHKTLQMLKRYTHLRAEDLAKLLG